MQREVKVAGALVTATVALYIQSLHSGTNRRRPSQHVLMLMACSIVTVPYVLLTSPEWYGFPMQLTVNLLVLMLDWFSFHEDKTRFSEEPLCLVGSCRRNAMITGHLAHWGDVAGVVLLLLSKAETSYRPAILVGGLVYGLVGSGFINRVTGDGSESDLRELSDEKKCEKARIMSDGWRGGLNDLITVLGVVTLWQGLFVCGDGRCTGSRAPLKVARGLFTDPFDDASTVRRKMMAVGVLLLNVSTSLLPSYSNYVNTSGQHGQLFAETYGLPPCFDDD